MIRTLQTLNYRCLRHVDVHLGHFHVLVGANGSGKTTFFDAMALLSDLLNDGLEKTLDRRAPDSLDLIWKRSADLFEIAVELEIPEEIRPQLESPDYLRCRYEVSLGRMNGHDGIFAEKVVLLKEAAGARPALQATLFPQALVPPASILSRKGISGTKTVVNKVSGGNDNFYDETGKGWDHAFKLGPAKSALANLPEDETKFPCSTWLKRTLAEGIETLTLNSLLMRAPSPPGRSRVFRSDGANLPWVVAELEGRHPELLEDWIAHLRTAIPDLESVRTIERPEDRSRYLMVRHGNGAEVPSWLVSDGTLRLMALTLPAYLPDFTGIYLIEEPENGIHPRAVETVYKSLSSIPNAQILVATHSPVILSMASADEVLCFGKTSDGETAIVSGPEHPSLRDWKGTPNLGAVFAGGVLD